MRKQSKTLLTSAEIASLWTAYMNNTMSICIMKYFLKKVEDNEIKSVISYTLRLTVKYTESIKKIFKLENFPIPYGFTNQDVNIHAPRLFTDIFMINFVKSMSKAGLGTYSLSYSLASRNDVRTLFRHCMETTAELDERAITILKNKGLYVRPPYISYPDKQNLVKDKSFLAGFTAKRRALASQEITHLFSNLDTNVLGEMLMTGFAQVAKGKDVKEHIWKGHMMAKKHKKAFSNKLIEESIPSPSAWDSGVTTSKQAPFSDKLMLFLISFLTASGIGNYGLALGASPRHDIALLYARLIGDVGLYAEQSADLLIEKGWMEEPPQAEDRERLVDL